MTRTISQRLLFGTAAAVFCLCAQATDELPQRAPGQWNITSEVSMMPGQVMTMQQCVDANTDADLLARSAEQRKNCSKQRIWREGEKLMIEAICKADASTVTINGVFSGDFPRAYDGHIESRFDPPLNGMRESQMKVSARRVGPCKPGQKPGASTVSIPGVGTIDIEEMMKNMPKMQGR